MYPSPDQATSVKWINRIGRLLSAVYINQPSLNIDKLLQAAMRETGLSDFGDPGFRDGLEVLVESLEQEAKLSQLGRLAAKGMIVNNLIARLQITDYRKQHPEIAKKPVTRPLIVVGLPRTGTTILFELLAQDPDFRSPLTWEIERPMPPPRPETFHSDPRIAEVEKSTRQADGLAPDFKAIHETGAVLPQECISILASHFSSEQFSISFNIPTYRAWALSNDMQAAYQWHHIFLQHLQADYMKQRWLLKAPVHIGYLDTLFAQYPDACVVQTHREPMAVIGSVSSLACTLRSAFSDVIDPVKTGPEEATFFAELLNRGMQQRDVLNKEQQFFDLQFKDIITDPVSAIRSMYEYFDFELTQEKADAMQHYLDNRPRDKHGKHKYTLAQFGLSEERHGHLFDEYRARYVK